MVAFFFVDFCLADVMLYFDIVFLCFSLILYFYERKMSKI